MRAGYSSRDRSIALLAAGTNRGENAPVPSSVHIRHIFISPGHNFFGRHGKPAGEHPTVGVPGATCRAGWGIEGDRFYGHRPDYKGQVTFFSWDVYEAAKREFGVAALAPSAFRRNVIIEGADLAALIGARFTIGDVEFLGTEESRPCYWMNSAVAPGVEEWLRGNGGLRTRVLTDGKLHVGEQTLTILNEQVALPGFAGKSLVQR